MANVYSVGLNRMNATEWFQRGAVVFNENGSVIVPINSFTRGSFIAEDGTWGTLKFEYSNDLSGNRWEEVTTFDGSESNHVVEFYDAAYLRMKITSTGYRGSVDVYMTGRV